MVQPTAESAEKLGAGHVRRVINSKMLGFMIGKRISTDQFFRPF